MKLAFLGLFPVPVCLVATAATAHSEELQTIEHIYTEGMRGGLGGSFGFYEKQVGGPVVVSRNAGLIYDPASALKTLFLTYAMRQVAAGADALDAPVAEYTYPNSRNADGNPASPALCPDAGDETLANRVTPSPTLETVLDDMMKNSDNRATRAIELRYGRANLNALAVSLGMASTRLEQIIGCGDEGGLRNSWTLGDAGRLYEHIDTGSTLPLDLRQALYGAMIGVSYEPTAPFVTRVVEPEAQALGIPEAVAPFAAAMAAHLKGGSYDICAASCSAPGGDTITRDEAGILTVPFQSEAGVVPTDFAWGSFITGEQIQCPPSCSLGERAASAMDDAVPEIFRVTVREALESWASLSTLSAAPGIRSANRLRVRATLAAVYGNRRAGGQPIAFSVDGVTICTATTERYGSASCTGSLPALAARRAAVCGAREARAGCLAADGPARYEASFAGGEHLFATTASAGILTRTPPAISGASQSRRRWRSGSAPPRVNASRPPTVRAAIAGTEFRLSLNEPAAVRFTFLRLLPGHRSPRGCRASATARDAQGRCLRTKPAGSFTFGGRSGLNTVVFQGRISRRARLTPGRYELVMRASSAGERSASHALSFTILG